MARDWIPIRTAIFADPKVLTIAEIIASNDQAIGATFRPVCTGCGCDEREVVFERRAIIDVTVTALIRVWALCNDLGKPEGDDVALRNCKLATLDGISQIPGFGAAMAEVGWAIECDNGTVRFPNFTTYNRISQERTKESNKLRQQRYRASKRNALRNVTKPSRVTLTGQDTTEQNKLISCDTAAPVAGEQETSKPSKPRKRCPLWDAIKAEWFAGVADENLPTSHRTRLGRLRREFAACEGGDTLKAAERLPSVSRAYRERHPTWEHTPEAILKRWHELNGRGDNSQPIISSDRVAVQNRLDAELLASYPPEVVAEARQAAWSPTVDAAAAEVIRAWQKSGKVKK